VSGALRCCWSTGAAARAIAGAVQHRIGHQPSGLAHGRSVGVVDRASQLDERGQHLAYPSGSEC